MVTLSNHLSGCYNSAALAKRLYEEENGTDGKKIAVIDSLSASAGELNIALFIRDLCEKGLPFEEICRQTEAYRDSMNTYFVIETLDFLKKNLPSDRFDGVYRVGAEYQAGYGRGQRYDHQA